MRIRLLVSSLVLSALALAAVLGTGAASGAAAVATPVVSNACGSIQYGGSGSPEALIVSDLPLQGDSHERSIQMNDAIRLVLEGDGWHAGNTSVGFQACDDSSKKTGLWTEAICKANAKAYAADRSVLAVIGTYNSGCAEIEIPILGRAPNGGVAMVSPGNTAICLTESSPSCTGGTPNSLYPKSHNYARVVPNDAYQGAGLASFAKGEGVKSTYVLYAGGDPTSLGQAKTFEGAAKQLGMKIAGKAAWNEKAKSYKGLMEKIAGTGAEAILLAGLTEENGAQVIKDKVAVFGPNTGPGSVKLLAPDGFAQQSTIELAGSASKGMFASVPGLVPQALTGPGKTLVNKLQKKVGGAIELYAPYAGQAAEVALGAIGRAGLSRSGTITGVAHAKVKNGITGTFNILSSGDPSVGPITVSQAGKTFTPKRVITPGSKLVAAARKG
ncbi:MAG TPA: branched-chain amino acid ABC transporter substrate-binding protein [Solirubrobacterales bacterium]|nr:branched-chain amino acid ABC transporter substrate-binding protein [Solirubrobacterales bacterium]